MIKYCEECKRRCNRRMTKEDVVAESERSFSMCLFCDFATYINKQIKEERYTSFWSGD